VKTVTESTELALAPVNEPPAPRQGLSTLEILQSAIAGGVTQENVAVVKEIIEMRREEMREVSKREFAVAFFKLKKAIAATDIYADKAAQHNGKTAYTYCSESEISEKLEPLLFEYGFVMLFSQRQEEARVVAVVTLIHEHGHQQVQEYAVRVGATNAMKDATAADTGSTTTAWRHLMIKLFGLKSRIRAEDDARNEGDLKTKVTAAQASELEHRMQMLNAKLEPFFRIAGATTFAEIPARNYAVLDAMLAERERGAK
jgi:ERF superfamily